MRFDAQLDRDDPDAQTLMRKIGAGLMDQASFAFRVIRQEWSDDRSQRTIKEVSLDRGDVSIVNYGASPTTTVDARWRRRPGTGNLGLYQAKARALALGCRPPPSPRHRRNLDLDTARAIAEAARLRGRQR